MATAFFKVTEIRFSDMDADRQRGDGQPHILPQRPHAAGDIAPVEFFAGAGAAVTVDGLQSGIFLLGYSLAISASL